MPKAYEEIAEELRGRITSGAWEPGHRLPSEEELKQQYRKGGPTVRQALDVLLLEGLIDKRHGRGTFVRVPRTTVRRSNERHQWEKDRARETQDVRRRTGATERDTGLTVDDLVFSAEYREATANEDLAGAFGVPTGTPLLERIYRTRYRREPAPFSVSHSCLVREHVEANPELLDEKNEPWPGGTHHQLRTVGIEVDRVVERILGARPPRQDEAKQLGMSPGMALIVMRETLYATDGRVVEVADVALPGDRTELTFVTRLARW
ncbi:GntR family transcriptional regulator [Streptomyces hoynatensis]|uniref:GntR family transcriptional regulator n=1 Tax=Streptomyces hoynatensis TaxID=1141874 RepID=A0A3A9YR95_9ACTN|nr:GntR family transcriptional regulator [Streptomyces hoynatensis]RKN37994.1 GntR family transcriptional regulator [Streptomyces hoynatensis]